MQLYYPDEDISEMNSKDVNIAQVNKNITVVKAHTKIRQRIQSGLKEIRDKLKLNYGTGNVEGNVAKDKICFSGQQEICLNNIQFLSVNVATNVEEDKFSGIIGLAPG